MLHATDVSRLLELFDAGNDGQAAKSRDLTLSLLSWSPEPFSRWTFTPGHVTCTGVVLNPERTGVLLVHHNRLNRWLLPGGHCELEDPTISHVAQREVIEETGARLMAQDAPLVGVDVHAIPGNTKEPMHLHHDLIFGFVASELSTECSAESRAVAWCAADEYERYHLPYSIRQAVSRAMQQLR